MKVCARRFNIYFALAAALALLCGCKTDQEKAQEKAKEVVGAMRVHIEAGASDAGSTQTISVLRSDPVLVTIVDEPILTEASLIAARVIDTPGGFAIEVKFDEISSSLLEQYTAENPGRHLVIFGQWGDKLAMAAGSPRRSSPTASATARWPSRPTCRARRPTSLCSASTTSPPKSTKASPK